MDNEFEGNDFFDEDDLLDGEELTDVSEGEDYYDDDFESSDDSEEYEEDSEESSEEYEIQEEDNDELSVLDRFLLLKGVNPRSIKLLTEEGDYEEVDFNDLSTDEKLSILGTEQDTSDYDLTEDEIQLLNQLRANNWNKSDYDNYIANSAILNYAKQQQFSENVNSISDEELFVLDLQSKLPDITNEELVEELENAKRNPNLFNKKIQSLRADYSEKERRVMEENTQKARQLQELAYKQFSDSIINTINSNRFLDVGLDQDTIEMSNLDMLDIAAFILGSDLAGKRYITKAFEDPNKLVEMAWFALKGKDAFREVLDYYRKQIANVRKNSYLKGYNDASSGRTSNSGNSVVSKRSKKLSPKRDQSIYDLD